MKTFKAKHVVKAFQSIRSDHTLAPYPQAEAEANIAHTLTTYQETVDALISPENLHLRKYHGLYTPITSFWRRYV